MNKEYVSLTTAVVTSGAFSNIPPARISFVAQLTNMRRPSSKACRLGMLSCMYSGAIYYTPNDLKNDSFPLTREPVWVPARRSSRDVTAKTMFLPKRQGNTDAQYRVVQNNTWLCHSSYCVYDMRTTYSSVMVTPATNLHM